ncbi:uncharacterized protein LAESUDRAFT_686017 [Laetiporus sulphureus 93-53]|uniref:Uncharacterized protein n=1 Tax=Laetiporus sulphureus 93-53 TaxID=1314785 RepID=A0A165C0L0_9APHY|nr:uncharacterized protein LAESUDRAFT_686017 [Laetiporus sulphureus 93-53]KZT01983.1 hypothetical protein LAESUDRAFT_686017 [Laetiporus sulphureus 93-53]
MSNIDFETAVKQEEDYLRALHPTADDIPGCMKLFDDYLLCHNMKAQLKSLYRFGHMSVCAAKMDEFKFCMSLKSSHPEDKRDAWIRRRAEWWAHRRLAKSSEDVWDIRTEPLENFPPSRPSPVVDTDNTIE